MNRFIMLIASFSIQMSLCGSLKKELNDFFESFGASANVSSAEVYRGQKAGYGTGGSVTVRNRSLNSKVATVNLPKIDAGCGGIDMYAGGFSFINNQKLVENLKSIASASAGYAFLLGIETLSPQIANQMKTLQSWSNTINGMGINSCETAAQLVGSVWPKSEMASQHICRTVGSHEGFASSYIEGRHQCSTLNTSRGVDAEVNEKYPNLLYGDYNLAWKAIEKQGLLSTNPELAELFMTITGTIIVKEVNGTSNIHFYPSQIMNYSFLQVLLEGGAGIIYKCSDKQCLVLKEDVLSISPELSWTGKMQKILIGIQNKILSDEELDSEERIFLAASSLPLYKIINVLTAYKHGECPLDLISISDVVAMDMLMQCLKEGVENIRSGCAQLRHQQMYADKLDEFMSNLDRVRKEINQYETYALRKLEREIEILKKIQMLEEQLAIQLKF